MRNYIFGSATKSLGLFNTQSPLSASQNLPPRLYILIRNSILVGDVVRLLDCTKNHNTSGTCTYLFTIRTTPEIMIVGQSDRHICRMSLMANLLSPNLATEKNTATLRSCRFKKKRNLSNFLDVHSLSSLLSLLRCRHSSSFSHRRN